MGDKNIRWVVKRDNGKYLTKDSCYTGSVKRALKYEKKSLAEDAIRTGRKLFDIKAGTEFPVQVTKYQESDWEEC